MNYLEPPKILTNYGLGVPPTYKTKCPICKEKDAEIFFNPHQLIRTNQVFPCVDCRKKNESLNIDERKWYEKNARGIFTDKKTGEEVVLDQRGKKMNNPYKNRNFDSHGWMQTNKRKFKKFLESEGKL